LPAVGLGLLAGGLLGLILDLTILRPVYRLRGEARVLLSLLLTLGVSFIIDGFLNWRYPLMALNLFIEGGAVDILGVPMRRGSLVASAITLVTFAVLFVFFGRTSLGRAIRSVIENEEGARLIGIDPKQMLRLILVLSGVLAALVALTRSMIAPVDTTSGLSITVFALIVTVVGGLGNVVGALLAGIILGIVNVIAADLIGSYKSLILLLVAAGVTILIRPAGLLGVKE
jgi:branched-chain amino acid transport system permease protein